MAEIPLRTYVQDIESLINHGRNDEAIAHCIYILGIYPKYVSIYRLLGKALLENQRFGDAADIFQRVLSSVPDDFVSHVGMSIVREDEGNFDEAIWHMERAFEMQPANNSIQDELRRLYGRRDGVEPTKIRLTRGALTRMYEKGELYQQAIAEIRTTIAEDPSRLDLQTLLAVIYQKTGQVVEAAETASLVLRKLPNCLIPIQVMTQLLTGTERDEDAKSLFKKLIQLDPYSRFASPQSPYSHNIPKNAIKIEKLKWETGQFEKMDMDQPAWVTSLGIDIEKSSESPETVPDWISDVSPQESETEPGELETPEEEIPSWMSAADLMPSSTGEDIDQSSETIEPARGDQELLSPISEDEEQISQADIPDWLKEMVPDTINSIEEDTPQTTKETDLPESLSPLSKGMAQEEGKQLEDQIDESEIDFPDWLTGGEEEPVSEVPAETAPEESTAEPSSELPDWLMESEEEPVSKVPAETEPEAFAVETTADPVSELPNWLMEGEEESIAEVPAELEPEAFPTETTAEPASELSDWLMESEEESIAEVPVESEPESFSTEPTAEPASELSDWLMESEEDSIAEVPVESEPESFSTEPTAEPASELPDWLMEGEEEPVSEVPVESEPEASKTETTAEAATELPDWLLEINKESTDAEVAADAEAELASDLPDWLKDSNSSDTDITGADIAAVLAEETEMEPTAKPAAKSELPDWLIESEKITSNDSYADGEAEPASELPDWLKELEEQNEPLLEDTQPILVGKQKQESFQEDITDPDLSIDQISSIEPPSKEADELQEPFLSEIIEEETEPDTILEDNETLSSEENGLDTGDLDAAFAWLENLAVKQGADEALILEPDERSETPPDWIQDAMEKTKPEYPNAASVSEDIDHEAAPETIYETGEASFEARQEIKTENIIEEDSEQELEEIGDEEINWSNQTNLPEIEFSKFEKDASQDMDGFDDAFNWLESLSVKQDKDERIEIDPEEQGKSTPEWVLSEIHGVEEDAAQSKNETEVIESIDAFELEEAVSREDFQESQDDVFPDEEEAKEVGNIAAAIVTAELRSLELQQEESLRGEIEFIEKGVSTEPEEESRISEIFTEEPEADSMDTDEISDVAALLDKMMESEDITTPKEAFEESPLATSETIPTEYPAEPHLDNLEDREKMESLEGIPDLPTWLDEARNGIEDELEWTPPQKTVKKYDLNEASLAELEKLPNVGFILAQQIVNFREKNGSFQDVEDLLQVPGLNLTTLAGFRDFLYIETLEQEPEVKDEPASEPFEPAEDTPSDLLKARQAFTQSDLENGLSEYAKMIKENIFLAEIISDLEIASETYSSDFGIWQNLGDAYLRTNQVQDALQAYINAEELLG